MGIDGKGGRVYPAAMVRKRFDQDGSDVPRLQSRPGDVPPPHSPEAESGLLGAILVDQSALSTALEYTRSDDFFHPANAKVMAAMVHLFEKGIGIDTITVSDRLRDAGELDAVGGPVYLGKLVSEAASPVSAEYYARIIGDKAAVRSMIATASAIVSEGYASELEPREFLDRSEQRLMAAGEERRQGVMRPLNEALDRAVELIEGRRERGDHVVGVPSGYHDLDSALLGFQPSDLVILAARPSMGKTSVALNIALNAARDAGKKVMFCSLEMSEDQLASRLLAIHKNINSNRLRNGYLSASEMAALKEARDRLRGVELFIDDSPRMNVLEIRARARRLRYQNRLDMLMVDYLQLIDPTDRKVSREQQISEISRSLKSLAKELQIPVIALSQLSRAPETRPGKDKRPMLSDLRESGAIEQDADVVMFLYRPEYYEHDQTKEEDRGILEVIIAKQRNGPTGTARLRFIGESMVVANLATE